MTLKLGKGTTVTAPIWNSVGTGTKLGTTMGLGGKIVAGAGNEATGTTGNETTGTAGNEITGAGTKFEGMKGTIGMIGIIGMIGTMGNGIVAITEAKVGCIKILETAVEVFDKVEVAVTVGRREILPLMITLPCVAVVVTVGNREILPFMITLP